MSKKVTFSCDFCRDEFPPDELVGFVWQGGERRWKIVGHDYVDFPHVCRPCASALVREIMASDAFPRPDL